MLADAIRIHRKFSSNLIFLLKSAWLNLGEVDKCFIRSDLAEWFLISIRHGRR